MKNMIAVWFLVAGLGVHPALAAGQDVDRLVASMLGETPILDDLRELTDGIGGRITGSPANARAIDWALAKFKAAGVAAAREEFTMPRAWLEKGSSARIRGGNIDFSPRIVAMPFTGEDGLLTVSAPILDAGPGAEADFERLGAAAAGAWVLIETPILDDAAGLDGLFAEYTNASSVEGRAAKARVAGVVYMSSRPHNLLYRHLPSAGPGNTLPMIIMEREQALRVQRLLHGGGELELSAAIDVDGGGPYAAYNVIGEIAGSDRRAEIVLVSAHIDSFDLGGGALDNGANVTLVIDLARQIRKLGLKPRRTIRFALFNGEEQGFYGSWGYNKSHAGELDNHVMTATFDIGTGRITGFFTNGRADIIPAIDRVLEPVAGLGPFEQINIALVGTDNFDFMLQGVANLVANQESANYASNYHARSDTFDKVDQHQLKLNSAIAAVVIYGFANMADVTWSRHGYAEIRQLVETTDLPAQMKSFGVWNDWVEGRRGRAKED